ncbi:MAG: OmpA family protein [Kiritimatiellae bacterium]|nr:OmpA family protein [Kiritimatiellia bacterium]
MTEAKDIASEGADGANGAGLANAGADLGAIKDEEGVPATGLTFDQDPNYVRCTDVDFTPVYFGFDQSAIPQSEMPKIEAVAAHLKQTGRVVLVEGNCDERGSNEYNLSLGELRAIAISKYLGDLGVNVQSVQTKSYGEEKPAVVGANEAAWSKNRRGEFAVFAHK